MNLVISPQSSVELSLNDDDKKKVIDLIDNYIRENPIVVSNITEPCVNEIISDCNIPETIKTRIAQLIDNVAGEQLTPDSIKAIIREIITEIMSDRTASDMTRMAQAAIESYFESDDFSNWLSENVAQDINFEDAVNEYISSEMGNARQLDQQITDAIQETVEDRFRSQREFQEAIDSSVDDSVCDYLHSPEVQDRLSGIVSTKLAEDQSLLESIVKGALLSNSINLKQLILNTIREELPVPTPQPVVESIPVNGRYSITITSDNSAKIDLLISILEHNSDLLITKNTTPSSPTI